MLTHLHDYVDLWWLWKIYPVCTHICLSLFVFISGYCLALGKEIISIKRLLEFFKQKLVRIYSLYIPALVLFFILYKHPYPNKIVLFIDHLLGFQLLGANYIEPYYTIWFIGLIIPYYILYGLSSYLYNSFKPHFKSPSFVLVIFYIALGVSYLLLKFDRRIVAYFPAFILGVYLSERGYFSNSTLKLRTFLYLTLFSLVLLVVFYCFHTFKINAYVYSVLQVAVAVTYVCMIALTFSLGIHFIALRSNPLPNFTEYLSYSSFAIYLFHRPILSGIKWVLSYLQIENPYILLAVYPLLVLPFIVFPISYFIQKSADGITKSLSNRAARQ